MNFVNVNNAFQQFMKFQSVMKQVDHGITIGNSVWIADKAFILPGVKIGDGAVIGANAIVSKDVAPYSVVTGIPAREIKKRFSDNIIQELLQLKWWDWSLEKIARNKTFFEADLSQYSSLKELIND
ncbi:MAG: CatB-related O-acetyltransferase [Candidatus Cloacimonetes bacterium]|nr:CatB-related O-acetyltransferase [Candidatus Cloacimonadota bacterium]